VPWEGKTVNGAIDREVLATVLELMTTLAGDWEYEDEITPETYLLGDLGLESLDLVVLGTSIQQRYGRLPFAEYLAEIGQRPVEQRDVSVGDLVAFVCANRVGASAGGSQ
jgi:acyl carrier protein